MLRHCLCSLVLASLFVAHASAQIAVIEVAEDDGNGIVYRSSSIAPLAEGGMMLGLNSAMSGNSLGMLQQAQYLDELAILDDQRKELRDLQREIQKIRQESFRTLRAPGIPFDPTAFRQEMEEVQKFIKEKTEAGLSKILIPAQRDRLEEIQTKIALRSSGVNALAGNRLADLLGLTDEQKKELAESQAEYQKNLQKGIEELRAKLQKEILSDVLSKEQLAKLKKLKGDKFDVKRTSFREQIEALRTKAKEKSEAKDK